MNKAVFLDRDGTINRDFGYVFLPEDLELLPHAAEGIRKIKDKGYLVVIISNQSAVGRGYCTEKEVSEFNCLLEETLKREGAAIDAIYYCPHTAEDACLCRKPLPGLFLKAAKEWDIDLAQSFCAGDNQRDVDCMRAYGCKGAIIGKETEGYAFFSDLADFAERFVV